jgi:hypothetical protein
MDRNLPVFIRGKDSLLIGTFANFLLLDWVFGIFRLPLVRDILTAGGALLNRLFFLGRGKRVKRKRQR